MLLWKSLIVWNKILMIGFWIPEWFSIWKSQSRWITCFKLNEYTLSNPNIQDVDYSILDWFVHKWSQFSPNISIYLGPNFQRERSIPSKLTKVHPQVSFVYVGDVCVWGPCGESIMYWNIDSALHGWTNDQCHDHHLLFRCHFYLLVLMSFSLFNGSNSDTITFYVILFCHFYVNPNGTFTFYLNPDVNVIFYLMGGSDNCVGGQRYLYLPTGLLLLHVKSISF